MAYNGQTSVTLSYQTAEDLSTAQFGFVKQDSTGRLVACDSTHYALGILENSPSPMVTDLAGNVVPGQYAGTVAVEGVTRVCVGAAYAVGTWIVPGIVDGTTGIGLSLQDSTGSAASSCGFIRALLLEASTAPYDVVACLLVPCQPGNDSTVIK